MEGQHGDLFHVLRSRRQGWGGGGYLYQIFFFYIELVFHNLTGLLNGSDFIITQTEDDCTVYLHHHTTLDANPHLCHSLLGAVIEGVLAHVYQLSEEHITDLREATAGRLHQGVQDGADVGLDAHLQQLLCLVENHT